MAPHLASRRHEGELKTEQGLWSGHPEQRTKSIEGGSEGEREPVTAMKLERG